MDEHLKDQIMALSDEFWQEQPDSSYVRWLETTIVTERAANAYLKASAVELETQLIPLQQQFDDWAEQNRRAEDRANKVGSEYVRASEHVAGLAKRVEELEAANARLRAALEAVEWEVFFVDGREYCPWCHRVKDNGHKPDCKRQQALEGAT